MELQSPFNKPAMNNGRKSFKNGFFYKLFFLINKKIVRIFEMFKNNEAAHAADRSSIGACIRVREKA